MDRLKRKAWLVDTEYTFVKEHTEAPIKVTMPSPSMFLNYWSPGVSDRAYASKDGIIVGRLGAGRIFDVAHRYFSP